MRTISIVLFDATSEAVSALFLQAGMERFEDHPSRWNYPPSAGTVLYISCSPYTLDREFPEDHADLLQSTGGRAPTLHVSADVSGRAPGDSEVRFLVELLLGNFAGAAFDDWTSYSHAWTLEEIRTKSLNDGFAFFDHVGHYERGKTAGA